MPALADYINRNRVVRATAEYNSILAVFQLQPTGFSWNMYSNPTQIEQMPSNPPVRQIEREGARFVLLGGLFE